MEWVIKMIHPVIKDCNTPEEAERAVIKWGRFQEPRDAALGLMCIRWMNSFYDPNNPDKADEMYEPPKK